jgi:hypothetical protein
MKHISTSIMAVLTLMLLATPQKAVPAEQIQVTTETIASQPLLKGTLSEVSAEGFGLIFYSGIQATGTNVGGTGQKFKSWTCKGRRDCSDLKKSGKCNKGTLKTGKGADGKYGGTCVQSV